MEELNPYRSPEAVVPTTTAPAPGARLYKVSGIGLATFFGSVLAGGWLMARNYRALGEHDKARRALGYSVVAAVVVVLLALLLPDEVPNMAFIVPQLIALTQLARRYQGDRIAEYEAADQAYSNWRAFGISLLAIPAFLLVAFAIVMPLTMAGVIA
ncbi:hypothetical protein [Lysobacter panacisoli]|uniref:Uncharacterized protein n=1 Tax=Lysobacter panacisoli TaxID=1255263 RepID=A0ABP9KZW6_9GAMM|nr:hypothetical protein [Lysobacter panacisoli]